MTLATLTVQGRYVYWVGTDEYNNAIYAPLVNATVRIWDSDSFCGSDDLLGVTATNNQGYYSIAVENGDCSGTVDVYAQALLENGHILVSDRDLQGGVVQYKFNTSVHDDAGSGTLDVGTYRIEGPGFTQRACIVFDNLNRGWSGVYAAGYNMRTVRAFYGSFVSFLTNETYYSSPAIYIGHAADANSFDVCVHEYGHAVSDWFDDLSSSNPCTGDNHYFDTPNTSGCAWQEGFADFLPVAIENDEEFNWPGGGYANAEILPDNVYEGMSSQTALSTEGAVARALYDLFDTHNELPQNWQQGHDFYSTSLATILDVLHDYDVKGTFQTFWTRWMQAGNPRHEPVQAIRLNQINFNTSPVWMSIGNAWRYPNQTYTLDVNPQVSDLESSDAELTLSVYSNSNSSANWEWTAPGQLSVTFPANTERSTSITLAADDGITTANSNTFVVIWSNTSPGKGYDPPEPCEEPCQTYNPPDLQPVVNNLGAARPNPFNPQTTFYFDLASADEIALAIYDVRGKLVRHLVAGLQLRGRHWLTWDGAGYNGSRQASGIYFIVLNTTRQRFVSKIVLLK